jgi:hypothetical protein
MDIENDPIEMKSLVEEPDLRAQSCIADSYFDGFND